MSDLIEILTLFCFVDCFNVCDDSPVKQLICTDHLRAYNSLLKMVII